MASKVKTRRHGSLQELATCMLLGSALPACSDARPPSPRPQAGSQSAATSPSLLRQLSELDTLHSLGTLESPRHEVFGYVADLAVDEHQRLYVLDSRYNELRVFDPDGDLLATAGGPGGGPGEFSSPQAVSVIDSSTVAVADRNRRVAIFTWQGGELSFRRSFRTPVTPEGMCATDGKIIVQGALLGVADMFHAYDTVGTSLVSFGRQVSDDHAIVRETLSWGMSECAGGHLAYLPLYRGVVEVYSLASTAVQAAMALPDYTAVDYSIDDKGRVRFEWFSPDGTDSAASLHVMEGGFVLVQVARRDTSHTAPGEYSQLHTHLLLTNGRRVGSSLDVPLIGAIEFPRVYTVRQLPYPRIVVASVR